MAKYAQDILNLITHSQEHLTAEQIYLQLKERSPKVVLATIYNNLNQLYATGQIRKVSVEGQPDRYDKNTRHDHLVCRRCGALSDICLPDLTEMLQERVAEEILSYDLKIHYLCPACRAQTEQDTAASGGKGGDNYDK